MAAQSHCMGGEMEMDDSDMMMGNMYVHLAYTSQEASTDVYASFVL